MITHQIKKGFDLSLAGAPARELVDAPDPVVVALRPSDFPGIKPKLVVTEGAKIRTGEPVFFDKNQPATQFCSPATGTVSRVVLGERRALLALEITPGSADDFAQIPHVAPSKLNSTPREQIVAALQGAGLWPLIRQRPVGRTADPAVVPSAIYVNGMDTEPLAADPAFVVAGRGEDLQAGIDLLRALSGGPVFLTVRAGDPTREFQSLQGVEMHGFAGPHPAGLVGTHISRIRPLKPGQVVWYIKAQEVLLLGAWLRTGRYPAHRVVAVAGTSAPQRKYFRVRQGASLVTLNGGKPADASVRLINGTVLNGMADTTPGFLGFHACTVTMIPEGADSRDLLGWALPQPRKLSFHRSVWPFGRPREVQVDARIHGGHRPIVNFGSWEAVTPLDILPAHLVRAIMANDLDESINLGLLEVTEEDLALCTVVDPCKIDIGKVIRQGLDLYVKES
ncbi:MAG: Na(+)-translocating NADH-quinone reductase subunit A [Planctomycetota bacterium]